MEFRRWPVIYLGLATMIVLVFQNCAQPRMQFDEAPSLETLSGSLDNGDGTEPPTNVICDPFSNTSAGAPGLRAKMVFYEGTDAQDKIVDISSMFTLGTKVEDTVLYFSDVNVPTRSFSDGFDTTGGQKLRTPSGQVLTEWFGLRFESNLQLMTAEEDGIYQLGTLSDDGSILEVNTGGGFTRVVENDRTTPTRMTCGSLISLKKGQKIPMRLWYFQGPRTRIALTLLWRRVQNANVMNASYCGKTEGFFMENGQWDQGMYDLRNDGWKVLKPGNFVLDDQGGEVCRK